MMCVVASLLPVARMAVILSSLGALAMSCNATGNLSGTGPARGSPHLPPTMFYNPVSACSALSRGQLQRLLGVPAPGRATHDSQEGRQFQTCTWNSPAGSVPATSVTVQLAFDVPAVACSASSAGPGYVEVKDVGNQAYFGSGRLQAWKGGLLVDLDASRAPRQARDEPLLGSAVQSIFERLDA